MRCPLELIVGDEGFLNICSTVKKTHDRWKGIEEGGEWEVSELGGLTNLEILFVFFSLSLSFLYSFSHKLLKIGG